MQARAIEQITDTGSAAGLLGFARTRKADAEAAEADLLAAAAAWAEMHPPESIHDAATWPGTAGFGGEVGLPLAGDGAPLVAEFCVAELAAALKMSTDAGRTLIAHGLELKYRLPRTHTRVTAGTLAPWRARKIAETHPRPVPGGRGVRRHPGRPVRPPGLLGPARAADRRGQGPVHARRSTLRCAGRRRAAAPEHPRPAGLLRRAPWRSPASSTSLMPSTSTTPWPAAPPPSPPPAARSPSTYAAPWPPGSIARRQLALDLARSGPRWLSARAPRLTKPRRPKPRQVVLYVHLSEAAIRGTRARASTWPGSRTAARASPPTRSGSGAPTPTPT